MFMFLFYTMIPLEKGYFTLSPCTKNNTFDLCLIPVTCPTCYHFLFQFAVSLLSRLMLGPREFLWNSISDEN